MCIKEKIGNIKCLISLIFIFLGVIPLSYCQEEGFRLYSDEKIKSELLTFYSVDKIEEETLERYKDILFEISCRKDSLLLKDMREFSIRFDDRFFGSEDQKKKNYSTYLYWFILDIENAILGLELNSKGFTSKEKIDNIRDRVVFYTKNKKNVNSYFSKFFNSYWPPRILSREKNYLLANSTELKVAIVEEMKLGAIENKAFKKLLCFTLASLDDFETNSFLFNFLLSDSSRGPYYLFSILTQNKMNNLKYQYFVELIVREFDNEGKSLTLEWINTIGRTSFEPIYIDGSVSEKIIILFNEYGIVSTNKEQFLFLLSRTLNQTSFNFLKRNSGDRDGSKFYKQIKESMSLNLK